MCAARVCVEHAYDIHTIITVQSRTHQYSILNTQYSIFSTVAAVGTSRHKAMDISFTPPAGTGAAAAAGTLPAVPAAGMVLDDAAGTLGIVHNSHANDVVTERDAHPAQESAEPLSAPLPHGQGHR